jgi:predicted nucleic acid-binding protein
VIYFDTNLLVYQSINQDLHKQHLSTNLIDEAIQNKTFCLSSLIIIEFIFVLSKLKVIEEHGEKITLYKQFTNEHIDTDTVYEAYTLCLEHNICKNINDVIHLKNAEKQQCSKLITFDNDFKKLQPLTHIPIEILS